MARLDEKGPDSLTDCELIELLVGGTSKRASTIDRSVLGRFGALRGAGERRPEEFAALPGVGPVCGARLCAAFELGIRLCSPKRYKREKICSPEDVYRIVAPGMLLLDHESFRVLSLGGRNELLGMRTVARGNRDACLVHSRDMFRVALSLGACRVILVHNHPSGDPSPSEEDRQLTKRAVEAGRVLGIPVIDHVVVARDGWMSLREEGWVD